MTKDQIAASRKLLLALHAQADQTPRLHGRRDAYRTALGCIEIVQAAIGVHPPVRVAQPLPEPFFRGVSRGGFLSCDGFTADQMRAYAAQAMAAERERGVGVEPRRER